MLRVAAVLTLLACDGVMTTPEPDSGTPVPDSGQPQPDSGTPVPDAGTPTRPFVFMAQGSLGRIAMSCDDGRTWPVDRAWDAVGDPLVCGATAACTCYTGDCGY